jgi:hypothetical protein
MKRKTTSKLKRPSSPSPRRAARRPRKVEAPGPREVRALSKTELVALVLKLQAAQAPAEETTPGESLGVVRAGTLIIDSSVRSGQTIEFPEGDVTVIGSVGSGAEIVAGGSIHVYGTLRGRAIAGMSGDQAARIFCQDLDAELLCIDGRYRVAENFDRTLRGRPVQARLEDGRMALIPLDFPNSAAPPPALKERTSGDRIRRATERMKQLITLSGPQGSPAPEGAAA